MPQERFLTTAQVAEFANVSVRTVGRWADSGRLPVAQRLPGKTGARLFDRADVERIITFATKGVA